MGHEHRKLRILLQRWAELEPAECERVAIHNATHEYEVGANCSRVHDVLAHYTRAVLLASLTEAAEAKGWYLSLTLNERLTRGTWVAYIGHTLTENEWAGRRAGSAYPEVALLEAYLLVLRPQ